MKQKTKKARPLAHGRARSNLLPQQPLAAVYWFCTDCEQETEPIESDQGQPNKCKCGSIRLQLRTEKPHEEIAIHSPS